MFRIKSRWNEWTPEGIGIAALSLIIFIDVDNLVKANIFPKTSAVMEAASALEERNASLLAHREKWGDIAREDARNGGSYILSAVAAFTYQKSVPLLWASHVVLTSAPNDADARDGAELARSLSQIATENIDRLTAYGGRMSQADGHRWAAINTLPLVNSAPVMIATIKKATDLGGMPLSWTTVTF